MDEKKTFWPIAYGGLEWFNTRGSIEVFLDNTRRIQIVYQDILTEEEWRETVEIYGLPARPKKTTKLSISVEYYGADKGAIVIRDLGFGSLYPTTNKIYRKEFDIGAIRRKHAEKLEAARREEELRIRMGDTEELRGEDPAVEHGNAKTVEAEPEVHEEPVVYYGTASPVEPETVEEPDDFGTEAEDVVEEIDDDAGDMTEAEELEDDAVSDPENISDEIDDDETESVDAAYEVDDDETESVDAAYEVDDDESESDDITDDADDSKTEIDESEPDDEETIDEEDLDDEDSDEYEQSAFSIPSYLRGQHFDPGE